MNLHLLGTGAALSSPDRTTTMLGFHDAGQTLVVDCGGDVVQRLLQAGLDLHSVTALIVTHEHPDHTAGFPLLIEKLWLAKRRSPLPVVGISEAVGQVRRLWDAYETGSWKALFPIEWRVVERAEGVLMFEHETYRVTGTPVVHSVPTMGLRVEAKRSGRVCAYSCDTEPSDTVVRMARGAHLLVHEATGEGPGHASAKQAAEIAGQAGVDRLVLVHLPPELPAEDLQGARTLVPDTTPGQDGMSVTV
ncbi:MAG TPA: MBL fold metallo-hydrolase [Rhodothermales bacterium]|nr:MBL fold metallo-hydrolase [Rhodothermales bacterium]